MYYTKLCTKWNPELIVYIKVLLLLLLKRHINKIIKFPLSVGK